jgi:hypothetical protein
MSTVKVNKITPRTCNSLQLGESGDTLTIPAGATLQNCGTATGFGLSFCSTVKTSPFTATANKGFFVNTGSAVTVTLPASPSTGDELIVIDSTGQAATNNITIGRNGSKIKGLCKDAAIDINRGGLRIVYSGCSQGWVTATAGNDATMKQNLFVTATGGNSVVTCGNFKTHIFTANGTFCVSCAGNPGGSTTVDYFVVAGGGASSNGGYAGGAGAGGFRLSSSLGIPAPTMSPLATPTALTVTATGFPITVGAGGTSGPGHCGPTNGSNSVFSTITSAGGGRARYPASPTGNGADGGSGAGGSGITSTSGGSGNTPPVSPPQGNNGGSAPGASSGFTGGGGGGAGAAGGTASPPNAGAGGAGSFIADAVIGPTAPSFGTPGPVSSVRYFAGGGGGAGGGGDRGQAYNPGAGGDGGGGAGSPDADSTGGGSDGTVNTGGGGGGGSERPGAQCGGAGGSGIVVIRYKFQ